MTNAEQQHASTPVLVVLLHGYTHSVAHMDPVKEVVQQALGPQTKVIAPPMDMGALSRVHPSHLALQVGRET